VASIFVKEGAGANAKGLADAAKMTGRLAGLLNHPPLSFFVPSFTTGTARLDRWAGVWWGWPAGQSGPVQPWLLVSSAWAAQKTLHARGRPRTVAGAEAPLAGWDDLRVNAAWRAAPLTRGYEGFWNPGGEMKLVGSSGWSAGGNDVRGNVEASTKADPTTTLKELLERNRRLVEEKDAELRARLPEPKRTGRRRVIYPPPYLGAAALLYEMGYSCKEVCDAVNSLVDPEYRMDEETLRIRLKEAGVKLRSQAEAVRRATLKGPRRPPRDTVQMAMAAALVQGDAAVRVKGRTMVEVILNTPYEGFARTVARLFEGHGTISLGARKYSEDYYEWQLIMRFDLKDWGFLIECKNSMGIPEFIKTDEELKAYLAMMLACEGHITWSATNMKKTEKPTTVFFVSLATNTSEQLIQDIDEAVKKRGYHTSITNPTRPFHKHVDRFGRHFESRLQSRRVLIKRADEVQRLLTWLGRIPHPMKEAYRLWALRLLRKAVGKPIRWSESKPIKERLDELYDKAAQIGRQRAKQYFNEVQERMNNGQEFDTRPLKAQTAPLKTYMF